jgi:hypothetical protein
MIERLLIDGVAPRVIGERLKSQGGPSEQSIRRHFQRGHLPVDARTVIERQDERAEKRWREHGQAVTEHVRSEYQIEQLVLAEFTRRVQSGRVKLTFSRAAAAAEFINRMERLAAADERKEQSERFGTVSLLTAIAGLLDVVHDVCGDDAWVEVIDRARRDVLDFERWSHHPQLAKQMAEHRSTDENRPHTYRNLLRKRWAKIAHKPYRPANPDDAGPERFAQEIEHWMRRLREQAA